MIHHHDPRVRVATRVKDLGIEGAIREYNAVTNMELSFLMESRNGGPGAEISRSDEILLFIGPS